MKRSLEAVRGREPIHQELHSAAGALFNEFILGGQDGLVNVLGVILGMAVATSSPRLVLIAGLAAAFAESFSMAAVAYTSGRAQEDYYRSELGRENYEIEHMPEAETKEIFDIYYAKGFRGRLLDEIVHRITRDKQTWLNIMMKEELGLSRDLISPLKSGLIVGLAAMIGSLIPLAPFFFLAIRTSILVSLALSAAALFVTGAVEGKLTIGHWVRKGIELALIGMGAALIGFLVGKWLGVSGG
jgi:VIT1/CCC1 family predicted Fe2+/Mn2+ transporter